MSEEKIELTQLLERADALEAELQRLNQQHEADQQRIAELEKQLASLPAK